MSTSTAEYSRFMPPKLRGSDDPTAPGQPGYPVVVQRPRLVFDEEKFRRFLTRDDALAQSIQIVSEDLRQTRSLLNAAIERQRKLNEGRRPDDILSYDPANDEDVAKLTNDLSEFQARIDQLTEDRRPLQKLVINLRNFLQKNGVRVL